MLFGIYAMFTKQFTVLNNIFSFPTIGVWRSSNQFTTKTTFPNTIFISPVTTYTCAFTMGTDNNLFIIYVDYINIMKSEYKSNSSENLYSANKRVAEELRALSFEFECPVVSVSQINRQGFYIQFDQLDLSHVAESMGIPATADFMAILGTDEDQMVYENEVLFKILKSRIGRMGLVDRFYLDKRSLKMYDSSEEEMWIDDATESGDSRAQVDREELDNRRRNNRRDRDRD
jgi:hypothetical protein